MLAAHRGGIKTILIPHENKKDLTDIPKDILDTLEIHPVKWIDEVLELALADKLTPITESDLDKSDISSSKKSSKTSEVLRH